ncbi:MAG TPA: HAD family hydrolase [Candidatus Dormibacteraeota bacterium]|nr:HAD family hydrolase [Candidatus Dormibacteraeota bacterium]
MATFSGLIRAIVFDFDGLILDTEEPVYRSWLEVYREHGEELPFERWVQIVGSTTIDFHPQHHLEERLGRSLTNEVLDRRIRRRTELILAQSVLPGVVQHMESAKAMGLKLGVASSSTRDWVQSHLERLGILDRFDCLRCRDDVANAKPEPDLYIAVIECLGVLASETIAIEDSPNGVLAAKRAGLRCVAIPNPITARLDLGQADLVLRSLADVTLADLLSKLDPA